MIPIEVGTIAEILLGIPVTNSDSQAIRWANDIVKGLELVGFTIQREAPPGGISMEEAAAENFGLTEDDL